MCAHRATIIPQSKLNEAENLLANGNFEAAMDIYNAMGNHDKVVEAMLDQAEFLIAEEEYYSAESILLDLYEDYGSEEAIQRYAQWQYDLGMNYVEKGLYAHACSCFVKAKDYMDIGDALDVANEKWKESTYLEAIADIKSASYESAIETLEKYDDYKFPL